MRLLPGRLLGRLFLPSAVLLLATSVATAWLVTERLGGLGERERERTLHAKALLLAELARPSLKGPVDPGLQARVRSLGREGVARLTVVRADTLVIADSEREDLSSVMPHGLEREELRRALAEPYGVARRLSETSRLETDYLAVRVEEEGRLLGFARAARPVHDSRADAERVRWLVATAAGAALAVSLAAAWLLARRVTGPLRSLTEAATAIAAGDYDRRVRGRGAAEVSELAQAFNGMAQELRTRIESVTHKQRELEAILGGMVEGVLAVDAAERVVLMNEAGGRILNLSPAEATGRPLWEVVRLPEVSETLAAALREGRPRSSEVRRVERPRDRVLRLHASPLASSTGAMRGAVLVLHDVTERAQLEQVRRDFVANASHELKTPIAAIRGLVETILDDEQMPPATQRRFLGSIQAQAGRLGDLVEEMLALSRLEAQGALLPRGPLDLRLPVGEALDALAPLARERRMELVERLGPDPVTVLGAHEPLRRVAANLVDNALKYTPPGGHVTVRVLAEAEAGVLEVEDDGPGIPPAERERIFERFYRLDKGRGRDTGGTGLGLAIVKHLVSGLGGTIAVEDAPAGGSLFRVRLPVAAAPPA